MMKFFSLPHHFTHLILNLIKHYTELIMLNILPFSPYDLKVMTNERDFKTDLSHTQNLMLAIGLSQRIVLACSQEFVENDLTQFESVANGVLSDVRTVESLVYLMRWPT